jgi:hypothetical protein
MNNEDLATVEAGGPSYLLMIDSLLHGDPNNESLLRSAATLYAAYTGAFVKDTLRAQKLTDKSLRYALRALCVRHPDTCSLREVRFETFANIINEMDRKDVPTLYALGTAWAGWIQAHREDLNAIAEISRVEAIMERVVELDESYQDGSAHLHLGVIATLLPPALGGRPEVGRNHFERAIEISGGNNLMAKVIYARQYARLLFDRELHDRLLREVMEADPNVPGFVLINNLAQQQAQELLDSAEDYF